MAKTTMTITSCAIRPLDQWHPNGEAHCNLIATASFPGSRIYNYIRKWSL